MTNATNLMIHDFSNPFDVAAWRSIDDRIMGGCSESLPEYIDGVGMRFHGMVSLENEGGFASIRSAAREEDLSRFSALSLKVRGDGKRYKLSLRTDSYFDGISYQAAFDTEVDNWMEIVLPFAEFIPTHHGKVLTTVEALHRDRVQSFGLFIADRQAGPFRLDIAWIKGV